MSIESEEHYEVWLMVERWVGDKKQEDCETTKIVSTKKRQDAIAIWEACEAAAIGVTPVIINNFFLDAET